MEQQVKFGIVHVTAEDEINDIDIEGSIALQTRIDQVFLGFSKTRMGFCVNGIDGGILKDKYDLIEKERL